MVMNQLNGGCHCGNIRVLLELTDDPISYHPRACDCGFCFKHGASYLSDPDGSLIIAVKDEQHLGKYYQGSGNADILYCKNCGVLVGVTYKSDEQLFAAINSKVVDTGTLFGETIAVSPEILSSSDKIERWKSIWFANVSVRKLNA